MINVIRPFKVGLFSLVSLTLSATHLQAQQYDNTQQLRDVQEVVAVVNDEVISLFDLKQRVLLYIISSGSRGMTQQEQQFLNNQALQSLVDDKLKIQEAGKYDVVISTVDKEQSFVEYAQQFNMTPQQLEERLNSANILKKSMLLQIEANLAWENVVGGLLMPQVNISDDEIFSLIERTKANKGQEEYHPAEIFFLVSENDKKEETRKTAARVVEQLREKGNFQLMARQFSQSSTSAVGGDLGWVIKSELVPEIIESLSNMEKGAISDPIETEDGFYIIQLIDKRKILTPTPLDAKVNLRQMLFPAKTEAEFTQSQEKATKAKADFSHEGDGNACENFEQFSQEHGASEYNDLGDMTISSLPTALHATLLSLDAGEAAKPEKIKEGYRIIALCEKGEPKAEAPTYEQVEGSLSQQRAALVARRHLRDLRRDAIIDYR